MVFIAALLRNPNIYKEAAFKAAIFINRLLKKYSFKEIKI